MTPSRRSGGSGARRRRADSASAAGGAPAVGASAGGPGEEAAEARKRPGTTGRDDEMSRDGRAAGGDRRVETDPDRESEPSFAACPGTMDARREGRPARRARPTRARCATSVTRATMRGPRRPERLAGRRRRRPRVAARGARGAALAAVPAPDTSLRRARRPGSDLVMPRVPADPLSGGRTHVPSQTESDVGLNPSRASLRGGPVRRGTPPAPPHRAEGRSSSVRARLHRRRGVPRREHPTGRPR